MSRFFSNGLRIAALALPAFAASAVFAGADDFSPELFPGLRGKSADDIRLAGIAALNPGRLVTSEPASPKRVVAEVRKTRTAELPRGGAYVRLYSPDAVAVRERAGRTPLVVDCRYLDTTPGDIDAWAAVASALSGAAPLVTVRGDYPAPALPATTSPAGKSPVLVIVNRETSGPLEAMLAALQAEGKIYLVGAETAGRTATYRPLPDHEGYWILSGEILPGADPSKSLVGTGAKPKFPVKVSPEDEFLGWQLVERGSPLAAVLTRDSLGRTESATAKPDASGKVAETPHAPAADPALQRAQDVVAALRVLGGR